MDLDIYGYYSVQFQEGSLMKCII